MLWTSTAWSRLALLYKHPTQSTALRNITSPTKAFSHTLSCHDGGRPGGLHEYTHTLSPIIHRCMLQICKVGFIQAIRTFFISNEQKYMVVYTCCRVYVQEYKKINTQIRTCIFSKTTHSPTKVISFQQNAHRHRLLVLNSCSCSLYHKESATHLKMALQPHTLSQSIFYLH